MINNFNESKTPKISVIVPVYNAEKYLRRCLDSIKKQTFTDFECIIINDGSTDSSGAICDEYAESDSRFIVFHKENGGVASARNMGMQNMRGDYSIHVDSDDWVDFSMFERMYRLALNENSDVIICDILREYEQSRKTEVVKTKPSGAFGNNLFEDLLTYKMPGSCCNKLVKNSIYNDYNISFPNSINYGEDWYVNCLVAYYAQRVSYDSTPYYHYRINDASIMHTLTKQDYINRFKAVNLLVQALNLNEENLLVVTYNLLLKLECFNSRFFKIDEIISLNEEYNKFLDLSFYMNRKHKIIIKALLQKNYFILFVYELMKIVKYKILK